MKKRFIGPANPGPNGEDLGHEVNVRGRYIGNVRSGEALEIPDELCAPVMSATNPEEVDDPAPVWPGDLWEDVADKPAAKKKGDDQ